MKMLKLAFLSLVILVVTSTNLKKSMIIKQLANFLGVLQSAKNIPYKAGSGRYKKSFTNAKLVQNLEDIYDNKNLDTQEYDSTNQVNDKINLLVYKINDKETIPVAFINEKNTDPIIFNFSGLDLSKLQYEESLIKKQLDDQDLTNIYINRNESRASWVH